MTYPLKNIPEFHINAYRLQYWLYAILNKKFGSEVKFRRDSLHAIYEVNRHGFEVSTNTMSVAEVNSWFNQKLSECGFGDFYGMLVKKTPRKTGVEELVVSVDIHPTGYDYDNRAKSVIAVGVQAYWHKK